jgi:hypothetical protein
MRNLLRNARPSRKSNTTPDVDSRPARSAWINQEAGRSPTDSTGMHSTRIKLPDGTVVGIAKSHPRESTTEVWCVIEALEE